MKFITEQKKFDAFKNSEMNRIKGMEVSIKQQNEEKILKEQALTEQMRRTLISHGIDPDPNWRQGSPLQK